MKILVGPLLVISLLAGCRGLPRHPIDIAVQNQVDAPGAVVCTEGLEVTILDAAGRDVIVQSPRVADSETWNGLSSGRLPSGVTVMVEASCYGEGSDTGFYEGRKAVYPGIDGSSIFIGVTPQLPEADAEDFCWSRRDDVDTLEQVEPAPCVISG